MRLIRQVGGALARDAKAQIARKRASYKSNQPVDSSPQVISRSTWIAMPWHAHSPTTIPMQRPAAQISDGKPVSGH
jgi:hypothetical protein